MLLSFITIHNSICCFTWNKFKCLYLVEMYVVYMFCALYIELLLVQLSKCLSDQMI